MKKYLILILSSLLIASCGQKDTGTTISEEAPKEQERTIVGSWKFTNHFYSIGGPGSWHEVSEEDSYLYVFEEDGTFKSTKLEECGTGAYTYEDEILTLTYTCDDFTESFAEKARVNTASMEMVPQYGPICTEGCSFRFTRQ